MPRRFLLLILLLFGWLPEAAADFVDHFATSKDIGPAKVPHDGFSRILVIPVNLDTHHRARLDLDEIKRFYSDQGPDRLSFPRYWRDMSGGRFRLDADVVEPVDYASCPLPPTAPDCTPVRGDISAAALGVPLIREILKRAKGEHNVDFSRYDQNGPTGKPDGYLDGLILILNGSHFGVALPFGLLDESLAFKADGVTVTAAALTSGPHALAVSLHEFGHLLGFADLYDEWGRSNGLALSLMGSWNYRTDELPRLDAFSLYRIGWAEAEQISGTRRLLVPGASTGKVLKLGTGKEFLLVENRGPDGPYDRSLGARGLAVFRVNLERLPDPEPLGFIRRVADCPNCRRFAPLVANVQADRRFEMEYRLRRFDRNDLFRNGDFLLPGPKNTPFSASRVDFDSNLLSGVPSGLSITEVDALSRLPLVAVTVSAPPLPDPCADLRCPGDRVCRRGRCESPLLASAPPSPNPKHHTPSMAMPAFAARSAAGEGCNTMDFEFLDWRVISILLFVLWIVLRPHIRRRYEQHLRKKGLLKDDENLKGRFG